MTTDVLPGLFAAAIADRSDRVTPSTCSTLCELERSHAPPSSHVCACTSTANPENKPASRAKQALVKIRRTTGLPWETVGVAVDSFAGTGIGPRVETKKVSKERIRGISTHQILRDVIIRVKLEIQPTDRIEVSNRGHN